VEDESVEEFVINERVFADVAFDEEGVGKVEKFLEGQGYEEGQVDVAQCYVEDVHEVDEVEQ